MLYVAINDQNYEEGFQTLVHSIRGETGKPPLGGTGTSASPVLSSAVASTPEVVPRILVFNLLKSLLPAQFDEVLFRYEVDESQIPMNTAQAQKAIDVIQFAKQKEGSDLVELLNTIYQAAPHLKR
jgi:hypothetical protein